MIGDYYRQSYMDIQSDNKNLADMTVMEATGYYLVLYPANGVDRLLFDMESREISYAIGTKVKLILEVINR